MPVFGEACEQAAVETEKRRQIVYDAEDTSADIEGRRLVSRNANAYNVAKKRIREIDCCGVLAAAGSMPKKSATPCSPPPAS